MAAGWASGWLARQGKKIKLSRAQLCPCGSGWVIASCCLDPSDNTLRKKVPSIQPPGPKTHFAHPNCYLRDTNNCSPDISREHYVSANVLEQIAASEKAVNLSGVPFLQEGETRALPVKSLTAKILCQRHNAAFSPLDQEAGQFFEMLTDAMMRSVKGPGSSRRELFLASGTTVELWMLKVACGLYFSRIGSSNREIISDTHTIDMGKVIDAFDGKWEDRAGLYFNGDTGKILQTAFHVQVAPLTDGERMGGVRVSLLGFECDLIFDTTGTRDGIWAGIVYRPHELAFEIEHGRKKHVLLSWPKGHKGKTIKFAMKFAPIE
ncbi:hypothetical protein ACQR2B_31060 [Bradyrhizobium oligotrophicum]|uniref:hypothetical protein n=1 Tax=Bradyrhizobium TaxID=374 RepID=UPI003EB78813